MVGSGEAHFRRTERARAGKVTPLPPARARAKQGIRSLAALVVVFAWLAAGCAPLAQMTEPPATSAGAVQGATRQLTILYTGYGRGKVEAALPAACG